MGRVFFNTRENIQSLTAAYVVIPSDSSKTFVLNAAAGVAITLPAVADMGEGWNCRFIVGTAFDTSNWQITATDAIMKGGINELETDDTEDHPSSVGATTIDVVHSLETVGDYVDLVCDGTSIFFRGQSKLGGSILLA